MARTVDAAARRRLGRSLAIRVVDAGSCNGCELEINALANAVWDLERFGLHIVASPRHADVLLVTGPVTTNMAFALERLRLHARSQMGGGGGRLRCRLRRLRRLYALAGGSGAVREVLPVHLHIKGCPPTPRQLLEGLLALLEA